MVTCDMTNSVIGGSIEKKENLYSVELISKDLCLRTGCKEWCCLCGGSACTEESAWRSLVCLMLCVREKSICVGEGCE